MCLGGHLAYRCALDSRVKAAVCYFATDIHSKTLAAGKNDDSLARAGDIKGELIMVRLSFLFLCGLMSGGCVCGRFGREMVPSLLLLCTKLTDGCRSSGRTTTMFHRKEGI